MLRAAAALSLSSLFAALLSGCYGCEKEQTVQHMTSKQRYDDVANQRFVDLTTFYMFTTSGGEPTTGGDTTGGTTGGDTGGNNGELLSDEEICAILCREQHEDINGCKILGETASGYVNFECTYLPFCGGRSHLCVRSHGDDDSPTAAAWLARAAHDEAASVHAFTALLAELTAHRAPESLLARLRAAADDEVRHAAIIKNLAEAHGAALIPPKITTTPPRTLLAIALENAREGCVNETWAALCAAHQARRAADPHTRTIFAGIAADEARHAELAWSLDTWLMGQLTAAERALVESTRRAAARELHTALADRPHGPELAALGLPDPATARHLAASLDETLWSAAA
jgi:hypothetical protein